jgi:hypothetical protein
MIVESLVSDFLTGKAFPDFKRVFHHIDKSHESHSCLYQTLSATLNWMIVESLVSDFLTGKAFPDFRSAFHHIDKSHSFLYHKETLRRLLPFSNTCHSCADRITHAI